MKKLYTCNAKCSPRTLYSYNTCIVYTTADGIIYMNCYRSNTTLMHIRKYIEWLREQDCILMANKVLALYRFCIDNKIRYAKMIGNTVEVDD